MRSAVLCALLAVAACGRGPTVDEPDSASRGPAGPAPLDSLRASFERAVEDTDFEAQARLYAADAVVQPSNRPPRVGREAIRAGYRRYLTTVPDATIDYEPVVSGHGGDHAWEAGSAFETGTGEDGVAHADSGKYLWVWTRTPDGWRISAHSFSLDFLRQGAPPGTPEGSP